MPATWRTVGASVIGTSHTERALPCQDANEIVFNSAGMLIVAVADGAGSARRADEGAAAAVAAAVAYLGDPDPKVEPLTAQVMQAVEVARRAVFDLAVDGDLHDLATTLVVVAATATELAAAQVGDGAVVMRRNGEFEVIGPAQRGEYLNETCFLTSDGWEDDLRIDCVTLAGIDAFAAMTDGLQLLAFDLATGSAHPGFFRPLFDWAASPDAAREELETFLGSPRVCERTDDDKTLVIATTTPPDA